MGDVDLPSKGKIFVIFNWVRKITNIGAELDFCQMKEERLRERKKEEGRRKKDRMERLDSKMDIYISSRNEMERRNQLPPKEAVNVVRYDRVINII